MNHSFPRTTTPTTAGEQLRVLRRQAKLSQLELALITGISQRHLSCIETGRAKPGPGTLHNLLMALEVPLEQCNGVFLASGYAPRYEATPLSSPSMTAIRDAISHVLHANNPCGKRRRKAARHLACDGTPARYSELTVRSVRLDFDIPVASPSNPRFPPRPDHARAPVGALIRPPPSASGGGGHPGGREGRRTRHARPIQRSS